MKPLGRIATLDFYRAVAVITVFLHHFHPFFPGIWLNSPIGSLGVDIFFVLSGFLLPYTLQKERIREGKIALRAYFRKRCARIIPAYYFALLIALLCTPVYLATCQGWGHILLHLFFVHNFFTESYGSILGVAWTLGVEMQFYLLVPMGVLFFYQSKRIWGLLIGAIIAGWGYKLLLWYTLFPTATIGEKVVYTTQLLGRIELFAIGMVLCFFYIEREKKSQGQSYASLLWILGTTLFVVYGVVFGSYWKHLGNIYITIGGPLGVGLLIGMSMWASLFVRGSLHTFLTVKCWKVIAQYSYGIYLWHLLVMNQVAKSIPVWWMSLLVCVLITGMLSYVSYTYIEYPFMSKVRRKEGKSETKPPLHRLRT